MERKEAGRNWMRVVSKRVDVMVIRGGSDVVVSGLLGRVQCWLLHVVHPVMLLVVAAGRVLDWSDVRTTNTTHLRFIAARSVEL